ncbi:MAG: hypothetical protein WKG00_09700 [Polyangiaceae bacterium]
MSVPLGGRDAAPPEATHAGVPRRASRRVDPRASRRVDPRRASARDSPRRAVRGRWDLDKTYLRADFDTVRDLVRTAIERPDRSAVPGRGAAARARARRRGDPSSRQPRAARSRLEEKLRLDGARWASLTLKPNLENLLRFRFRALRGQLGYKLPALLEKRSAMAKQRDESGQLVREVLLGDDAEADAFVYSLYADICHGDVDMAAMTRVMRNGGAYDDTIEQARRYAERWRRARWWSASSSTSSASRPAEFRATAARGALYNYLQAAFVLLEDGRLSPAAVLRVARDLCVKHNFDGSALARSYLDLARRGHVSGAAIPEIADAFRELVARKRPAAASDLAAMVDGLTRAADDLPPPRTRTFAPLDYSTLVGGHNKRRAPKR